MECVRSRVATRRAKASPLISATYFDRLREQDYLLITCGSQKFRLDQTPLLITGLTNNSNAFLKKLFQAPL
jgi:hypothetical protein